MSATNSVGAPAALVEVDTAVLLVGFEVLFDDVEELQAASASIIKARAATLRGRVNEAMGLTVPLWQPSSAVRVQHLRRFLGHS